MEKTTAEWARFAKLFPNIRVVQGQGYCRGALEADAENLLPHVRLMQGFDGERWRVALGQVFDNGIPDDRLCPAEFADVESPL